MGYNFDFYGIYPITCRGGNPVFIYKNDRVISIAAGTQIGTLEHPVGANKISAHMDDFDGSFYIYGGAGIVYKEAVGGGTIAEIGTLTDYFGFPVGMSNDFIFTNLFFISQNTELGRYTINKVKGEFLFKDKNLCYLTKIINPNVEIKDYDFYSFKTEENKDAPLMSFTIPSGLVFYTVAGQTSYGNVQEHAKIYDSDYNETIFFGEFNDLRSFDMSGGIYTDGGLITLARDKYILLAMRDGRLMITPSSDPSNMILLSNNLSTIGNTEAGRVETANYSYPPYMFASFSGTTVMEFFQRDPGASAFVDYSTGGPSQDITVIRLDDRI